MLLTLDQDLAKLSYVSPPRYLLNGGGICIEGHILLSNVLVSWALTQKMLVTFELSFTSKSLDSKSNRPLLNPHILVMHFMPTS